MKSCKSWGYIATVIIGLALVSAALAERLTTFAWNSDPGWPNGTTIELCGNGPTCLTGLTGLSATLSLPVNPGEVIQGMARAIPPPGYQCGEPLATCLPSEWVAVQATWPAIPINGWARYQREEITPVADPVFQNRGTLDYRAGAEASSLSTTITDVQTGDLLVVQVQRDDQNAITGVASASPALTFLLVSRANYGSTNFSQDIWTAIATADAASMTVTASYSGSAGWGSMISYRWSGGIESATPTHSAGDTVIRNTSTNRTAPNITTTTRALLIAAGTDWDFYPTHTAAANWTKILDSQTLGTDSTMMYMHVRIADAGTYPNGNFATTNATDHYFGSIIAYEVDEGVDPVTLTIQNSVHGHASQSPALTQAHTLAVQAAAHGHAAQALALTQAHALAVQNSVHGHLAQALNLSAAVTLQVDPAQHGHTAQLLDLLQAHALAVQGSIHGHLAANIGLTQAHVLAPAGSVHGHAAQSLELTQAHVLAPADSVHGHFAQAPTLTQAHALAVQNSVHGHNAAAPILITGGALTVANAVHGHALQGLSLAQAHALAVQNSVHGHAAQPITLTQAYMLAPGASVHGHFAQAPTLSAGLSLSPESAVHDHVAQSLELTQAHVLDLRGSAHGHVATGVALIQGFALIVGDGVHGHTAAPLTLDLSFILAIQNAVHQHHATALELATQVTLVVSNAVHQHLVTAASDLALPPGDRIFVVEAEDRVFVVIPDDRVFVV